MVAAQLYGRPRDRVFHVLVSAEFESNREFYYPARKSVPIELKDKNGQPYVKETRFARVNLVPIPFVSMRDRLSESVLTEPKDPATRIRPRSEKIWKGLYALGDLAIESVGKRPDTRYGIKMDKTKIRITF